MSAKRKTVGNPKLNFRPSTSDRADSKGTKPCRERETIGSVLTTLVMQVCKSAVFFNTHYKVCGYLLVLFVLSVLSDVLPFPRTPFARKDNFFNVYFVKISWGWTLLTLIPFVMLTSLTYCCGRRDQVVKHLIRLLIATTMWYFWTNLFVYCEHSFGRCSKDPRLNRSSCLVKGYYWHTLDVSGHCFILIYSALVFIEECRVIINWDSISDMIMKEEHTRNVEADEDSVHNPLKNLSNDEFDKLKDYYKTFTPYIKSLFLVITLLIFIWDFMLLTTILYFHNMLEKLLAGAIAISVWYATYRLAFRKLPFLTFPGEGSFKYRDVKFRENGVKLRQNNKQPPVPKFMGNPLKLREEPVATDSNSGA